MTKNTSASRESFMKACNGTICFDALKSVLSYMDDHYDKDCHILARLYDGSRYTDHVKYKGYRDYYLRVAGYT